MAGNYLAEYYEIPLITVANGGASTETTAEFDNTSFGLYKGVLAGSSGTIRIEINNGNNIARATIVMDGRVDQLTSSASFTAGQAIDGAQFTGTFSSFTFSVDADGGNPTIVTIAIEGHAKVVATVEKEKSGDVAVCYEGTSVGGNDHRGVFNVVRKNNTFSGVANAVDGFSCSVRGTVAADGSFTGTSNTTFNGLAVRVTYSGRFAGDKVSGSWTTSWNANGTGYTNSGTFSGGVSDTSAIDIPSGNGSLIVGKWEVACEYALDGSGKWESMPHGGGWIYELKSDGSYTSTYKGELDESGKYTYDGSTKVLNMVSNEGSGASRVLTLTQSTLITESNNNYRMEFRRIDGSSGDAAKALVTAHPWKLARWVAFVGNFYKDDPETPEDERYRYNTEDIGTVYTFRADGTVKTSYSDDFATYAVVGNTLTLYGKGEDGATVAMKYNITKLTDTALHLYGEFLAYWENSDGEKGTYTYYDTVEFVKP